MRINPDASCQLVHSMRTAFLRLLDSGHISCRRRHQVSEPGVACILATLTKKFVSCPAGGRNYGQSGGRKILFFSVFFSFSFGKKMIKF